MKILHPPVSTPCEMPRVTFSQKHAALKQEAKNFLYQIPTREMESNTALGPKDQNGYEEDKDKEE